MKIWFYREGHLQEKWIIKKVLYTIITTSMVKGWVDQNTEIYTFRFFKKKQKNKKNKKIKKFQHTAGLISLPTESTNNATHVCKTVETLRPPANNKESKTEDVINCCCWWLRSAKSFLGKCVNKFFSKKKKTAKKKRKKKERKKKKEKKSDLSITLYSL